MIRSHARGDSRFRLHFKIAFGPEASDRLRRDYFDRAKVAMEAVRYVDRHAASIDMFLDGPGSKGRNAVHILFANEKVREEYVEPTPD